MSRRPLAVLCVRRSPALPFSPGQNARTTQRLLTYAIKDTVSVLYWYEKLSRNGKFFDKIFGSFFFIILARCVWWLRAQDVCARWGGGGGDNNPQHAAYHRFCLLVIARCVSRSPLCGFRACLGVFWLCLHSLPSPCPAWGAPGPRPDKL